MAYKQIKQLHKNIELMARNTEKEGTCFADEVKIKAPALDRYQGEPRKIDGLRACKHHHVVMIAKDENFCPLGKKKESDE